MTENIFIKGAKVHNLKNINVEIPVNQFTVITGLSGSGKSSLAFDTLFAEGQRRYIESLSSYARQFIGRIEKPDVENIVNISPAIAIEQKVNTTNKRSTVGTSTEIYDYLKLLFSRIGKTFDPVSGELVKKDSVSDIIKFINQQEEKSKFILCTSIPIDKETNQYKLFLDLSQQGFTRVFAKNTITTLQDLLNDEEFNLKSIRLVIDRLSVKKNDEEFESRLTDSIENAMDQGDGCCEIVLFNNDGSTTIKAFNSKFERNGVLFEEPTIHFFSFNNPIGACKRCEGYGSVIDIDEHKVIPNKSLSVYEGAVACWKGEKMKEWKNAFILQAAHFDFPIHKPYNELSDEQRDILWNSTGKLEGINAFFKHVTAKSYKIQFRVLLSRYRGKTRCPECKGTRLRADAANVKINEKSIIDLVLLPLDELSDFFKNIELTDYENGVSHRILIEINSRVDFLIKVGLNYLTLNRLSSTLSGGESQRINLATSLGSSLIGTIYVLDEPSIGLHSKDTTQLIEVLHALRDLGNTVVVVEHDEDIIKAADYIIDLGPKAGSNGGNIVFEGPFKKITTAGTLTSDYITQAKSISIPENPRPIKDFITLKNANKHNLKNVSASFPLNAMSVVTGVSGSGKSTLIKSCLIPNLNYVFESTGQHNEYDNLIEGPIDKIKSIEFINQNPIGKSSRSTPITYVKAYDDIRALLASQPLSKSRRLKPAAFSFNTDGGRCDWCKGEGVITIEMQFMANVQLTCEECDGKRFKEDVLEIKYENYSIADLLSLTIDQAIELFQQKGTEKFEKKILDKILPLQYVGLGYVKMGQSSSTLSGGEAQRIKLASFIGKRNKNSATLFIFDEPTTGLHFHDIQLLLKAFYSLLDDGHTLIVIEHNMDVIKTADWIVDLGPGGGKKGGELVYEGHPRKLCDIPSSHTGKYLKEKFYNVVNS